MRPYGERNKFRYNYIDHHPKKGYVNWWETELGSIKSKKTARQKIKTTLKNLFRFL